MGSTLTEIEACARYWVGRLIDPSFATSFRRWLQKEHPKTTVVVEGFHISRFPVTNGEYVRFLEAAGGPPPESIASGEPDDHPVWGVDCSDAERFCGWYGRNAHRPCRLPTEAEWEYAAQGPSGREYPFGDEFDPSRCNTIESGIGTTTPVDRYPHGASEWGVYDLAGNVEEWTADLYRPYPGGRFVDDDLSDAAGGTYRVLRGGSFARGGDLARCARRHGPYPGPDYRYRGFRVVLATAAGRGTLVDMVTPRCKTTASASSRTSSRCLTVRTSAYPARATCSGPPTPAPSSGNARCSACLAASPSAPITSAASWRPTRGRCGSWHPRTALSSTRSPSAARRTRASTRPMAVGWPRPTASSRYGSTLPTLTNCSLWSTSSATASNA